jgi:hypothetical protein
MQAVMPDKPSHEESRAEFDANEASAAIARLTALLESCDGDAAEAFLAVERALAGQVASSPLDALGTAISEFDFETALVKLNELTLAHAPQAGAENSSLAARLADAG